MMEEQNIKPVNSHFLLSVIAVLVSCLGGFWTIPMALAALIFTLRTEDLMRTPMRLEDARRSAWWAGLFGWLTLGIALLPMILMFFFGGAILAFIAAAIAAAAA